MKSTISQRRSLVLAGFVAGAIALLSGAGTASALTITPIRLELAADPGRTLRQEITLYNEHESEETLYVSYANFEATGENGNPTFVDPKDDIGTWMTAAEKVTIAGKSSQIVPLLITVPADAVPGGHFGAVFWGTVPPNATSNQVSIGAKTGLLVLLSVKGNVSEQGGIIEYGTVGDKHFYTSLPVSFYYRFQNNGGDRVKPTGEILMKNMLGITSAHVPGNPVDGNVLPSSTRKIETAWQGHDGAVPVADKDAGNFFTKAGHEWRNFAFGHYTAKIRLAYGTANQISEGSVGLWVFPWHFLTAALVGAALLFFILRKLVRHYNAWVIARAEEMLRKREKTK